jgi:ATP/maltotriose-dependent transcriptional regulator MalT
LTIPHKVYTNPDLLGGLFGPQESNLDLRSDDTGYNRCGNHFTTIYGLAPRRLLSYKESLLTSTGIKMKENTLQEAHDEMEWRIQERTCELEKTIKGLEDTNVALRVLLNRLTEDNKKLEERLKVNITELVIPYLEKLKQASLDGRCQDYLTILEANLNDIVSPFIQNITAIYRNLTPSEIRVAEMIKQGKASKDIAEVLNASVGTINTHRNNIRKKLNLKNQSKNLRSYLLTLG